MLAVEARFGELSGASLIQWLKYTFLPYFLDFFRIVTQTDDDELAVSFLYNNVITRVALNVTHAEPRRLRGSAG